MAVDREMAHRLATPPENVDKTLWLYELCRFLTQKVNAIIIALFSDNPPCSSITCPEMRASEWQYLCAVHEPPKSCCAIDYCCHTLDWAANTLTSPKNFPSRLAMGTEQSTQQHQQIRNMTNIFRRVYRIFAHAWFQHRDMFWKVEARTGLYVFFKTVCDVYGLIPDDNYTIPPEAEGEELAADAMVPPPMILKRDPSGPGPLDTENSSVIEAGEHTLSTAGTTKRHRHSPSVGAMSVATVVEESEEEEPSTKADRAEQEEEEQQTSALESPPVSIPEPVAPAAESATEPVDRDPGVEGEAADESKAAPVEEAHASDEADGPNGGEEDAAAAAPAAAQVDKSNAEPADGLGDEAAAAATAEEEINSEAHATADVEAQPEKAENHGKDGAGADHDGRGASN